MKLTKSYVINIKSNRKKYLHFSNQAKKINLNFSFFEVWGGPGWCRKLWEAERNNNPPIFAKTFWRVPSYDPPKN